MEPTVEKRHLAQPARKGIEAEACALEDLSIRLEQDLGPGLFGLADLGKIGDRLAALVLLCPGSALAPDLQMKSLGKRVDDGDADTVQTTRDGVRVFVELAARVQGGHDYFRCRLLLCLVNADGDATAVVFDGD